MTATSPTKPVKSGDTTIDKRILIIDNDLHNASSALQDAAHQLSNLGPLLEAKSPAPRDENHHIDPLLWKIHSNNPVYTSTETTPRNAKPGPETTPKRVPPLLLASPAGSTPSKASQASSLPGSARKAAAEEYPRSFPVAKNGSIIAEATASPESGGLAGWMRRNQELQKTGSPAANTKGVLKQGAYKPKQIAAALDAAATTPTKPPTSSRKSMMRPVVVVSALLVLLLLVVAAVVLGPGAALLPSSVAFINKHFNGDTTIVQQPSKSVPEPALTPAPVPVVEEPPKPVAKPIEANPPPVVEAAPKPKPAPAVDKPIETTKSNNKPSVTDEPSVLDTLPPAIRQPLQQAMAVVEPHYTRAVDIVKTQYISIAEKAIQPYYDRIMQLLNSMDEQTRRIAVVAASGTAVATVAAVIFRAVASKRTAAAAVARQLQYDENHPVTPRAASGSTPRKGRAGAADKGSVKAKKTPRSSKRLVSEVAEKTPDGKTLRKWNRV